MRLVRRSIAACGLAFALGSAWFASAQAPQQQAWGDLEGSFELVGQAPAAAPVVVGVDKAVCGALGLVDESLVVGRRNGIANIVVMLQPAAGVVPAIHPEVAAAVALPAVFDNAKCRFEPRIGVVTVGQALKIGNLDPVGHNVNAALFNNDPFNVLVPTNATIEKKFKVAEPGPMPVTCNIHPWMKGYLVVAETPYVAVTSERGTFEIENLPVGKWKLRVWHERAGNIDKVTIGEKQVAWTKGIVDVEIQAGKNDLGKVQIAVGEF